jgi:DNA repair ATPase RecN
MTGLALALKNSTTIGFDPKAGSLNEVPDDFWVSYQTEDSIPIEKEEIEEINEKMQNLYFIINDYIASYSEEINSLSDKIDTIVSNISSMFDSYYMSYFEEENILKRLVDNANHLFPDCRSMTKEEIKKEKEYKLKKFEIIEI